MQARILKGGVNIYDLLRTRYNVNVTDYENPLITSVGVTPLQIVNNNPRRLGLIIINLSANIIYLSRTPSVSATNGIVLSSGGGNVAMTFEDDYVLPAKEWWVVASGGASAIYSDSIEIYD